MVTDLRPATNRELLEELQVRSRRLSSDWSVDLPLEVSSTIERWLTILPKPYLDYRQTIPYD